MRAEIELVWCANPCGGQCRYVVRQGQGGRQSAQDKTGKFAKSAGSRLRRHNEAALERDIQETLAAWKEHLASCDLVFVHANAINAKPILSSNALDLTDPRVRRIPFVSRRPTFKVRYQWWLCGSQDESRRHVQLRTSGWLCTALTSVQFPQG